MPLQLFTFDDFVSLLENGFANGAPQITNLRSGSVALALIQAVAGNAVALEQVIVAVYNSERLATSTGTDVDSFVGDFGMTRDPAVAANQQIQMNRTGTGTTYDVPLGAIAQNPITKVQYTLVADNNNAYFDPVNQVYHFGTMDSFIFGTFAAAAGFVGSVGNTPANTITQIVSGMTGISSITNLVAFTNGADTESDAALKARFVLFIGGLRSANKDAVSEAIEALSPAVTFQIYEYFHFDGTPFPAGFTIVVDDGSGNAPDTFTTAVYNAVDAVRAAGAQFEVHIPTVIGITIGVHIVPTPGTSLATVQQQLSAALSAYIYKLGTGVTCSYVGIANVIEKYPGVYAASGITLNGIVGDAVIAPTQLAQFSTVTYT